MILHLDAARLTSPAALVAALDEALGFLPGTGKNLDALVDCLTHLDEPHKALTRVHVFPGQVLLLVIDHTESMARSSAAQLKSLADVVAFVNWRRLERRQPPIVTVAYEHGSA